MIILANHHYRCDIIFIQTRLGVASVICMGFMSFEHGIFAPGHIR